MRVIIDADGCPVVSEAVSLSAKNNVECHIFCDTSHMFSPENAVVHTVSKGADSADFALCNFAKPGDIVITQDYGAASMALSRGAFAINQDGLEYTADNIDALLFARHTSKKIRNAGGRLRGPKKRTDEQTAQFVKKLEEMLKSKG